jgi:hypothetical protein
LYIPGLYKTEKTITHYVEANNEKNKIKLIGLFTREATVIEEGNHYKGIDQIKTWRRKINTSGNMLLEIVGGSRIEGGVLIDILCYNNLSESPVIVQHHFVLKNNLIDYLRIQKLGI